MSQVPAKPAKNLIALVAPLAAFVLLIGGGWFLVWFWHGMDATQTITLNTETTQALEAAQDNANQTNDTPAPANTAVVTPSQTPVIPTISILNKGVIRQQGFGNTWAIYAASFLMRADQKTGSNDFDLYFSVRFEQALDAGDRQLAQLALQLMFNPLSQRQSGAPIKFIIQLRDKFNRQLPWLSLKLPDADVATLRGQWNDYVAAATQDQHEQAAIKLMDSLTQLGIKALPDNQASFQQFVGELRQMIPEADEQKYQENIRNRGRRPAAAPSTQPAA